MAMAEYKLRKDRRQRKGEVSRNIGKMERDLNGVRSCLVELKASFDNFEESHEVYHDILVDEKYIDKSETWYKKALDNCIKCVESAQQFLDKVDIDYKPKPDSKDKDTKQASLMNPNIKTIIAVCYNHI